MIKIRKIKIITILFLVLSCSEAKEFDQSYYFENPSHVKYKEYVRDSLYLVRTGHEFLKFELPFWEFVNYYFEI